MANVSLACRTKNKDSRLHRDETAVPWSLRGSRVSEMHSLWWVQLLTLSFVVCSDIPPPDERQFCSLQKQSCLDDFDFDSDSLQWLPLHDFPLNDKMEPADENATWLTSQTEHALVAESDTFKSQSTETDDLDDVLSTDTDDSLSFRKLPPSKRRKTLLVTHRKSDILDQLHRRFFELIGLKPREMFHFHWNNFPNSVPISSGDWRESHLNMIEEAVDRIEFTPKSNNSRFIKYMHILKNSANQVCFDQSTPLNMILWANSMTFTPTEGFTSLSQDSGQSPGAELDATVTPNTLKDCNIRVRKLLADIFIRQTGESVFRMYTYKWVNWPRGMRTTPAYWTCVELATIMRIIFTVQFVTLEHAPRKIGPEKIAAHTKVLQQYRLDTGKAHANRIDWRLVDYSQIPVDCRPCKLNARTFDKKAVYSNHNVINNIRFSLPNKTQARKRKNTTP